MRTATALTSKLDSYQPFATEARAEPEGDVATKTEANVG
jgi:hypothetical protein